MIKKISTLIGIVAVAVSIYYSYLWLYYIGAPWYIAAPVSIVMVSFAVICFEVAVKKIREASEIRKSQNSKIYKAKLYITAGALFIVWAIVAGFSMSSTVAGQYNSLIIAETDRTDNSRSQDNSGLILQDLDLEIQQINNTINRNNERIGSLTTQQSEYKTGWYRENYAEVLTELEDQLKKLESDNAELLVQIQGLREQRREILATDYSKEEFTVNSGTIYDYFSALFGINPLFIQFFLSIFPALFVDLIAPISFAMAGEIRIVNPVTAVKEFKISRILKRLEGVL